MAYVYKYINIYMILHILFCLKLSLIFFHLVYNLFHNHWCLIFQSSKSFRFYNSFNPHSKSIKLPLFSTFKIFHYFIGIYSHLYYCLPSTFIRFDLIFFKKFFWWNSKSLVFFNIYIFNHVCYSECCFSFILQIWINYSITIIQRKHFLISISIFIWFMG